MGGKQDFLCPLIISRIASNGSGSTDGARGPAGPGPPPETTKDADGAGGRASEHPEALKTVCPSRPLTLSLSISWASRRGPHHRVLLARPGQKAKLGKKNQKKTLLLR